MTGTPLDPGPFHVSLRIRDAVGHEVVERMSTTVIDPGIGETALAAAAGGVADAIAPDEAIYLDHAGNRNGRLDVADVRALLVRTGVLRPPGG